MADVDKSIYLKGYREGFEASLKLVWALADLLLIEVNNVDKDKVREFIKKLTF